MPVETRFEDYLTTPPIDLPAPNWLYPDDVMEECQAEKMEQFGEERWMIVENIMAHFARLGIYLADVKPGNISFAVPN